MALWTAQLIFNDNTLVSEGFEVIMLDDFHLVMKGNDLTDGSIPYTKVIISCYALSGQLRCYDDLGVSHWRLDIANSRIYMSDASQLNTEPVSTLSSKQRVVVRDFLITMSESAWDASNRSFRQKLAA